MLRFGDDAAHTTMKLHILSDLHTEFADFVPPETNAEAVILAGDIGVGVEGMRWRRATFPLGLSSTFPAITSSTAMTST